MPWAIPRRTIYSYSGMWHDVFRMLQTKECLNGREVEAFEGEFADYIGVPSAVAAPSARAAMDMILKALEIPPGSKIAVPAYTADCIPEMIKEGGWTPVFVDIDLRDHNVSIESLEIEAKAGIDVAIITHLFGRPCRLDEIMSLSEKYKFLVVEDFSHAIGAAWKGKKVGSFGVAGFCTFSTTKSFNTFGGGVATASDLSLGKKLRAIAMSMPGPSFTALIRSIAIAILMKFITSPMPFSIFVFPMQLFFTLFSSDLLHLYNPTLHRLKEPRGVWRRYSNLQAYIGRQWLRQIDEDNKKRMCNAKLLNEFLDSAIDLLEDPHDSDPVYWLYMLTLDDPTLMARLLLRSGIDSGTFFMGNCADASFKNTESVTRKSLQIPLTPNMDRRTINRIAKAVNRAHDLLRNA